MGPAHSRWHNHAFRSVRRLTDLEKQILAALRTPGRTEGVRKIAKRFGIDPGTVQRISRLFEGVKRVAARRQRAVRFLDEGRGRDGEAFDAPRLNSAAAF